MSPDCCDVTPLVSCQRRRNKTTKPRSIDDDHRPTTSEQQKGKPHLHVASSKMISSKNTKNPSAEDPPEDSSNGDAAKKRKHPDDDDDDHWDLVWPCRNGVVGNPGDCTVLLQIDPENATTLDMEGASGAIGRLEVDGDGGECLLRFFPPLNLSRTLQ